MEWGDQEQDSEQAEEELYQRKEWVETIVVEPTQESIKIRSTMRDYFKPVTKEAEGRLSH